MPRIQFAQNTAATLELFVPTSHGQPSGNATLTIYTSGESELTGTFPASVALDAASGVVQANASEAAQTLTLDTGEAASFSPRRSYMASSTLGELLLVRPKGVDTSGDVLHLEQPLAHALNASSTVQGHRYAYTLSLSQTATRRRHLRATWNYTAGGIAHTEHQYFDVVRWPFRLTVTEEDLEKHDPYFGEYAGSSKRWEKLIDGAHDDLERALRARQIYPDLLKDRESAKDALCYRILWKFYAADHPERADGFGKAYKGALSEIEQARDFYDANDDNVVSGSQGAALYDSEGNLLGYENDSVGEVGGGSPSELGLPSHYLRVG